MAYTSGFEADRRWPTASSVHARPVWLTAVGPKAHQ